MLFLWSVQVVVASLLPPNNRDSIRLQHVLDRIERLCRQYIDVVCTVKPIIEVNKRSNAQRDKWIWVVRTKKRFTSQAILSFFSFEHQINVHGRAGKDIDLSFSNREFEGSSPVLRHPCYSEADPRPYPLSTLDLHVYDILELDVLLKKFLQEKVAQRTAQFWRVSI